MWRLFAVALLWAPMLVLGQTFQCTPEKLDSGEHCVFRDVNLGRNTAGVKFAYPADVAKPSQVTFVDSNMEQLPSDFLTLAGPELKVLSVENCGLVSITIPSGLEALYAKDNSIEKVIVHQSGSGGALRTLDLSGNKVRDFSNVTKCQALEMLNLSGNGLEDTLDLGKFKGLNKLRQLDLSHNDINYLDNTGNVNLESLEDLDLSHNNILPSDLKISIFYPYTKLYTLRLNDNLMSQLDYNYLLIIKSLKTVYLNGNNFQCKYLDSMLKHLKQNNLQTPPGELTSCRETNLDGFCCTGPLPTKPTPSTSKPILTTPTVEPIKPQPSSTTEQSNILQPVEGKESDQDGGSIPIWKYVVGGGVIVLVIAIVGFVIYKKMPKKESRYMPPPLNSC